MATYYDPYFLRSLIRGPLAQRAYQRPDGEWVYYGRQGAYSSPSASNRYYGFEGLRLPPEWPDGYINIQYPDFITETSYGDVPPAEGTDVGGGPGDWTYSRQLRPDEDGGQWFCPDMRTLLHAGKCVRGYEAGRLEFTLDEMVVLGGPTNSVSFPPPADYTENDNDWEDLHWPTQVHWPPVDLNINFGQSVYSALAFDPEPDFMQVYVSFTGGQYGSYNTGCVIAQAGMPGYQDWMAGKPMGCGDSILEHPQTIVGVEPRLADFPWGIGVERYNPITDSIDILPWTPSAEVGGIVAESADYPYGQSEGHTSDGSTVANASVWPAIHPYSSTEGFLSSPEYHSTYAYFAGEMTNIGGYILRAPDLSAFPPVWQGEPLNTASETLWDYRDIAGIFGDWSGMFGMLLAGMSVSMAFYWLPPEESSAPSINFGDRRHHFRRVRGGRVGDQG